MKVDKARKSYLEKLKFLRQIYRLASDAAEKAEPELDLTDLTDSEKCDIRRPWPRA